MRAALDECETLIEARADAVLEAALAENAPWAEALGAPPTDCRRAATWHKAARVVAAYRDRYHVTDEAPLGAPPECAAQKIDAARTLAAVARARGVAEDIASTARDKLPSVVRPSPYVCRDIRTRSASGPKYMYRFYLYDDLMVESSPTTRGAHDTAPPLGGLLCGARRPAALSAQAVAEASGLSIDAVRSIASGRTASPAFITVARLASVLKVSLDRLSEATHVDERDS